MSENDFQLLLICCRDEIKERNEQYRFKIHLDNLNRKAYPLFYIGSKGESIVYLDEDINGFVDEKQREGQSKFLKALFDDLLNHEYEFERTEDLITKQYEKQLREHEEQKRQRRLEIQRQRERDIED